MEGYRELELFIGPFAEWKGQTGVSSVKLVCNGNVDTLRIDASVSKSIRGIDNSANITIYNLSQETREALRRKNISIKLYAGFEGEEKELVFAGGVLTALSFRQGTNIITKLSCRSGIGPAIRAVTSTTYTHGTSVKEIVKELAANFPNITVDPTNINVEGKIGYAGWSYVGLTKDALNKLAYQYGFSWTIQDGKFVAKQDRKSLKGRLLLDKEHGLRKVSPRLTGPMEIQEGVDIQATYNPGANPGSLISYKSEYDTSMNQFTIYSVEYELAPKTGNWDMNISSFSYTTGASWKGEDWLGN